MKTQSNFRNMKKAAIAIFASLAITASGFAIPFPNASKAEAKMALARLDQVAKATEASLTFNAPRTDVETETAVALFNLDQLAETNLASLRYTAPEVTETVREMENLEELALYTEAGLKYKAPLADETGIQDNDYLLASEF